jgi:MFS superfamily sulfate permease-like transporter
MMALLNKFFFVFHSCLIVFILIGWAWRKTRLANLVILLLTAFSWFILGLWYGYGYCPSTDWHWRVRSKMGIRDLPESYTKFLVDSLTGGDVSQRVVDIFTLVLLLSALAISLTLNIKEWRENRKNRTR